MLVREVDEWKETRPDAPDAEVGDKESSIPEERNPFRRIDLMIDAAAACPGSNVGRLKEALEEAAALPYPRARARAAEGLGRAALDREDGDEAERSYREAEDAYAALGDDEGRGSALEGLCRARLRRGRFIPAVEAASRALAIAESRSSAPRYDAASACLGFCCIELGLHERGLSLISRLRGEVDPAVRGERDLYIGWAARASGRFALAREAIERAEALLPEDSPLKFRCRLELARLSRLEGRTEEARGLLARLRTAWPSAAGRSELCALEEAEIEAAEGRQRIALERVEALFAEGGQGMGAGLLLGSADAAARFAEGMGEPERARPFLDAARKAGEEIREARRGLEAVEDRGCGLEAELFRVLCDKLLAIAEASREIMAQRSTSAIAETLRSKLRRITDFDGFSFAVADGNGLDVVLETEGDRILPRRAVLEDDPCFAAWCFRRAAPVVVDDLDKERPPFGTFIPETSVGPGIRSLTCVPVEDAGKVAAVLSLASSRPGAFGCSVVKGLQTLAAFLAVALRNARSFGELQEMASRDGLTDLFNRRTFEEIACEEFQRARRYGDELSLIMMDLDRFKEVNDRYGHAAGDAVLRGAASIIRAELRSGDSACRYGGEEFVVVLPHTGADGAFCQAERLRNILEQTPVAIGGGASVHALASFGTATLEAADADHAALAARADEALLRAKRAGRNKVCRSASGGAAQPRLVGLAAMADDALDNVCS